MATPASVNQTIYLWQGTDKNGKKTKGEMPGASQALVKAQLRKQGVIATRVKRKPKDLFGPKKQKITPGDIAIFSRLRNRFWLVPPLTGSLLGSLIDTLIFFTPAC